MILPFSHNYVLGPGPGTSTRTARLRRAWAALRGKEPVKGVKFGISDPRKAKFLMEGLRIEQSTLALLEFEPGFWQAIEKAGDR